MSQMINQTTLAQLPAFVAQKVSELVQRNGKETWEFRPGTYTTTGFDPWARNVDQAFWMYMRGSARWIEYPMTHFALIDPQGNDEDHADIWLLEDADDKPSHLIVWRIQFGSLPMIGAQGVFTKTLRSFRRVLVQNGFHGTVIETRDYYVRIQIQEEREDTYWGNLLDITSTMAEENNMSLIDYLHTVFHMESLPPGDQRSTRTQQEIIDQFTTYDDSEHFPIREYVRAALAHGKSIEDIALWLKEETQKRFPHALEDLPFWREIAQHFSEDVHELIAYEQAHDLPTSSSEEITEQFPDGM